MYNNQDEMVEAIRVEMYNNEYFYKYIIGEIVNEYTAKQITAKLAARRLGMSAICTATRTDWNTAQQLVPQDALDEIGSWLWEQAKEDWELE